MGRVLLPLLCKWDWNLIHVLIADNSKQSSHVPVFIRILDINDHAPEFAMYYETFVCENAKPGQVNEIITNFKNSIFSSWRQMTLYYFTWTFFIMQHIVNTPGHSFIILYQTVTIILKKKRLLNLFLLWNPY